VRSSESASKAAVV